jgi:hypothetical protein
MKRFALLLTLTVLIAFPITAQANENNGTPGMPCNSGEILSPGYTCVNNVITEGLQAPQPNNNPTDEPSARPADEQGQLDARAFNTDLMLYLLEIFF